MLGPPDPPAACCGRTRADALRDHIASGCAGRAYSADECGALAARGVIVDEEDQHDDCDYPWCTCDDDCACPCAECAKCRALRERYADQSDVP